MIIRKATQNDIAGIMSIVRSVVPIMIAAGNMQWSDTYPNNEVFETDIQQDQLWLGVIDEQIAAVAAYTTAPEPDYASAGIDINAPAIVTHRLAVSPLFQGCGIAAAMMKHAEEVARQKNIKIVRSDTNVVNTAMQKVFINLGYKNHGEISLTAKPGLRFYCFEKHI